MKSYKNILTICAIAFLSISMLAGCSAKSKAGKEGADGLTEAQLNAEREARFGNGNIPSAEGAGLFRDVHFDYDSSTVSPEGRTDIEYNVNVLKSNPSLKISLEGHCDERGTAEYNMALGNERARAVRQVLISLGVDSSKLETISYGEEVPLDPRHSETAWAKNRRVHFSAFGAGR